MKAIVLDELSLGKTWKDDKVNTVPFLPSRLANVKVIQSVVLGRANFQDIPVTGRNALFVMTVFEGPADFRDTRFDGTADFRYSVFGKDANYKRMTLTNAAFFGNTRYIGSVTFREMRSLEDLYFNSAVFEGPRELRPLRLDPRGDLRGQHVPRTRELRQVAHGRAAEHEPHAHRRTSSRCARWTSAAWTSSARSSTATPSSSTCTSRARSDSRSTT